MFKLYRIVMRDNKFYLQKFRLFWGWETWGDTDYWWPGEFAYHFHAYDSEADAIAAYKALDVTVVKYL